MTFLQFFKTTFILTVLIILFGDFGRNQALEAAPTAPAAATLVARWPLNDGTSTLAYETENDYEGSITGATWTDFRPLRTGHNHSLSFDGDKDYIDTDAFDIDNNFTIATWVNIREFDQKGSIIAKHTSGGSNQLVIGIYGGGYHVRIRSASTLKIDPIKGWQHLVVTGEETATGTLVKIYRDAVLLQTVELAGKVGDVGGGKAWTIGQEWDGGSRSDYFTGSISETRIYNGAMTPAEVSNMYPFLKLRIDNDDFWSNTGATACIAPLGLANNAAFGAGLTAPPPTDLVADVVEYETNLALKFCAPVVVPSFNRVFIDTESDCQVTLKQEAMSGDYANVLGVPLPLPDNIMPGSDWGDLGTPFILHHNTDVKVTSRHSGTFDDDAGEITFRTGVHDITWRGETMVHALDFIPILIPGPNPPRKVVQGSVDLLALIGGISADALSEPFGIYNEELQYVVVTDLVRPTISVAPSMADVSVEAIEIGGVSRKHFENILRDSLTFSDNCDDDPWVYPTNMPLFANVGEVYTITWTVQDEGPRTVSGGRNEANVTQILRVVDTKPPIMLAPPSIVTETVTFPAAIELGHPGVFDLADLNPTVSNDACEQSGVVCESDGTTKFPSGQTTVTWTATDGSGNSASVTQLVNLKALGTNNAPTANSSNHDAVSFEPITLTLTANDPDADPLWFSTVTQPTDGFFKAPLLPYFIQDYRLTANGVDFEQHCRDTFGEAPYTNYPVRPEFMAVDDDGNMYLADLGDVTCDPNLGDFNEGFRIAKILTDGTYIEASPTPNETVNDFYIDYRLNHLVVADPGDSHSNPWVYRYDLDTMQRIAQYRVDYADYPNNEYYGANALDSADYAVVDDQGILYIAGLKDLWLFDTNFPLDYSNTPMVALTKYFDDGVQSFNSFDGEIDGLALDSDRNLFVSTEDRVYKFSPATLDADKNFSPGEVVGWLGDCNDGADCDVANERSFGFRCTDATCTPLPYSADGQDQPGQFRSARGMAIGPNDILYVTDYYNERVQRFTQDGYFAGLAESECGGSCFTLGDFGRPTQVTVNNNNFYVLDDRTDLLHIFETTPIRPKTNNTAEVVYQSNNNFVGSDSFQYEVSDGLATSSTATVTIDVTRNYRAPRTDHYDESLPTVEDTPLAIALTGYDPDEAFDTLTFPVVTQPENGSFSNGVYTPNADFEGTDSFEFVADDGTLQSDPRTVTVTVSAENDPPRFPEESSRSLAYRVGGMGYNPTRLSMFGRGNDSVTVGRGYSAAFTIEYSDPDDGLHMMSIDWGDGTVEQEGQALEDGTTTGPLLLQAMPGGPGLVTGSHIYETSGSYTMEVCIRDTIELVDDVKVAGSGSAETCKQIAITVADMVDVSANLDANNNPLMPNTPLRLTIDVLNQAPEQGTGLTANDIVVTTTLPANISYSGSDPSQGTCSHSNGDVVCNLLGLSADNSAEIDIFVSVDQHTVGESFEVTTLVSTSSQNQAEVSFDYEEVWMVDSADFVVDTLADTGDADTGDLICADADGNCSLRAAVTQAGHQSGLSNQLLTIALGAGSYEAGSQLLLRHQIELVGLGATQTRVSMAGGSSAMVAAPDSTQIIVKNMAIHGTVENIYGNLTLDGVTISNGNGGSGGGLYVPGLSSITTVRNSSITGNHATTGGGIYNQGEMLLENVTVSGNSAETDGGIVNIGFLEMRHVTISHNHADSGTGGLKRQGNTSAQHTIIAKNTSNGEPSDCDGPFFSLGYNLIETSCSSTSHATDIVGVDPLLVQLNLNDAETLTLALKGNSPALNAGGSSVLFDQRGVARDGSADIGAYERIAVPTTLTLASQNAARTSSLALPTMALLLGLVTLSVAVISSRFWLMKIKK